MADLLVDNNSSQYLFTMRAGMHLQAAKMVLSFESFSLRLFVSLFVKPSHREPSLDVRNAYEWCTAIGCPVEVPARIERHSCNGHWNQS